MTHEDQVTSHNPQGYGLFSRILHWLTALTIVAAITLGLIMTGLPAETEAEVARILQSFSLHKTIGATTLVLGLLRILWTAIHPGPGPLHPERRLETFLARLVHWLLWIALLTLPLSGWLYHSAAPGFAPILWPFGQSLPFVGPDEARALIFRSIHRMSVWLLLAALGLHVLGTLKHVLFDRDATLARMIDGRGPSVAPMTSATGIALSAVTIWAAVVTFAILTAPEPEPDPFAEFDSNAAHPAASVPDN